MMCRVLTRIPLAALSATLLAWSGCGRSHTPALEPAQAPLPPAAGSTVSPSASPSASNAPPAAAEPTGAPDARALAALAATLAATNTPPAQREDAIIALATNRLGGARLIELAERGLLPTNLTALATEWIYRNPELALRLRATRSLPRLSREARPYPPWDELAATPGDVDRGRQVYFGPFGSCHKCHRIENAGTANGPDLAGVGARLDRTNLFDAILNPAATIVQGYETWWITLTNGDEYYGCVVADADPVVLREATAQERRFPRAAVASRQLQSLSLMAENTAETLVPQELADLVAYLSADRSAPSPPPGVTAPLPPEAAASAPHAASPPPPASPPK